MLRASPTRLVAAVCVALALSTVAVPAARADSPTLVIDWPSDGVAVGSSLALTGWAVAPAVADRTGIDAVRAFLDGPLGAGTPIGQTSYGLTRSDVALTLRDGRFGTAGWRIDADLPPGSRDLFVYAHLADQADDVGWIGPVQVTVRVESGAFTNGIASERVAPPPPVASTAASACAGRDTCGPSAASATIGNNCAVPDRESGRCLVRSGATTARGPTAGVPGSWTAIDPTTGTSASGGGTAARMGYPLVASQGSDRPAADAASGPAAPVSASPVATAATSAGAAARPGSNSLSLTVAAMGGRQSQLSWNAYTASPVSYEVRRCATLNSAPSTCGVVATVQGGGYRLSQADGYYFVRAVGPGGQVTGESNRVQLNRG